MRYAKRRIKSTGLVLDGYGLSVTVSRGHVLIRDGQGRHRRERRLPGPQRIVQRVISLGEADRSL